jgi:hypothetical protein
LKHFSNNIKGSHNLKSTTIFGCEIKLMSCEQYLQI